MRPPGAQVLDGRRLVKTDLFDWRIFPDLRSGLPARVEEYNLALNIFAGPRGFELELLNMAVLGV